MEWREQYKHPNWQRKRMEVLDVSGFKCQRCGDTETQIHVHHKRYVKGRMVWEYGIDELEVLCDTCHEVSHAEKDAFQEFIAVLPSQAIPEILGLLIGYCEERPYPANATGGNKQFQWCDAVFASIGFLAATVAKIEDGSFASELAGQIITGGIDGVLTVKMPEKRDG